MRRGWHGYVQTPGTSSGPISPGDSVAAAKRSVGRQQGTDDEMHSRLACQNLDLWRRHLTEIEAAWTRNIKADPA